MLMYVAFVFSFVQIRFVTMLAYHDKFNPGTCSHQEQELSCVPV